ncbi:MAG TPA: ribonuclease D [Synechococcales cyanobacterium M55_K2018_004]|nr:ribonuclease D [Synechococcales cyanobacterium M55_K2018_004]
MTTADFQVFECDLSPEMLDRYLQADAIAIDTETMGLVPQRDRLCLVQLCDPQGFLSVIRIHQGQTTAPHLQHLLEAPTVTKVFHYARFDIATLRYHLRAETTPVFCTKIASKLARTYSPKHGLKDLVNDLEGIELDKASQSSDWGNAANLSEEQLRYAANDVRYLLRIQQRLIEMLQREGRLALAYDCFRCLPTIVTLDLLQFSNVFEHGS